MLLSLLNDLIKLPLSLLRLLKSRRVQGEELRRSGIQYRKKLVVFFIPGMESVTGGVLQIFSLYRLTHELICDKHTSALICWLPGTGWNMHKFEGFRNDITVYRLKMLLPTIASDCELLFHLPEYAAQKFCDRLGWDRLKKLRADHSLRINILNQNIEKMPDPIFISRLKLIFPDITCTAGNPSWASAEERKRLDIPIHILPTWYYPDNAPWQPYETKLNLMIVSPDHNPNRERVLGAIRAALPGLTIKVIQGLKYEQYLELERTAKWSLTFGEGFDGYFYGPVLRGGVAFAVRNGTFDLPGFEDCSTIYPDYESMAKEIADGIRSLDNKQAYEAYNTSIRIPITKVFSQDHTSNALAAFYRGE